MNASLSRPGPARAALLAVVLALAVLAPVGAPATAAAAGPVVTYMDVGLAGQGTRWLRSAEPTGASSVALTPSTYRVHSFDVSQDGSAVVAGLSTPAVVPSPDDRSYALVLVQRTPTGATTRVLCDGWDTNPVVSADGSTVWWMFLGFVWKYHAGVTTLQSLAPQWSERTGETVTGFAVSPDGSQALAVYDGPSGTKGRVVAGSLTDAYLGDTQPFFEKVFTDPALQPDSAVVAWLDDDTPLYGVYSTDIVTESASMSLFGGSAESLGFDTTGLYDIRRLGSSWWVWRESGDQSQYAVVPDLASVGSATFTSRSNGSSTMRYVPSDVSPPSLTSAVNRATTTAHLSLSRPKVTTGSRVLYSSYADYKTALPRDPSFYPTEVSRGLLQRSTNRTSWSTVGWTSWAHPVPWPGDPGYYGNAYTPVLTRNSWFRWVFPGDYLTRASTSPVRKVVVTPIIKAKVVKKGGKRVVSGTVTRVGGKLLLYRGSRKVATAAISSSGSYRFKARSLSIGRYTLKVRADASWGAASKKLKV